jgi:hypothetical protein
VGGGRQGRVIRRYAAYDEPEYEGDPLPWETLANEDPDHDSEYGEHPPNEGAAGAQTACRHLSVDPAEVGPDTRARGHGWLAVTEPGVGQGAFSGMLRL